MKKTKTITTLYRFKEEELKEKLGLEGKIIVVYKCGLYENKDPTGKQIIEITTEIRE